MCQHHPLIHGFTLPQAILATTLPPESQEASGVNPLDPRDTTFTE